MRYQNLQRVLIQDLRWLQDAGFVVETEDSFEFLDEPYRWFMQGKLKLSPSDEIRLLRRIERVTDLGVRLRK
jgi:hypothetical protein